LASPPTATPKEDVPLKDTVDVEVKTRDDTKIVTQMVLGAETDNLNSE
jgi:hypothetical protein